jgi:hypothetical protein
MAVRILESGEQRLAVQGVDDGGGTDERLDVRVRSDGGDPPTGNRHRRGGRGARQDAFDPGTGERQVGGLGQLTPRRWS